MISGETSCFENGSRGLQMYGVTDDVLSSSHEGSSSAQTNSGSLLYNFSILKDKVHQVQSMVNVVVSPDQGQPQSVAVAVAIAGMGTLIQEIIVTASSMMFACQQLALIGSAGVDNNSIKVPDGGVSQPSGNRTVHVEGGGGQGFFPGENLDWYGDNYNNHNNYNASITISNNNNNNEVEERELSYHVRNNEELHGLLPTNYDIIELDAADLLAKYTHYCQICGKGFKRDANLRMHMRAHGDEYKSTAALSNPMKKQSNSEGCKDYLKLPRKYSCPQEGCRWNRKHAKFQPLKSMICVKNHYKRSHCPKMYICNRCNRKQFSVLSDLRTHEKHCGDLKWQCSCGTTFSRKDKLMGHVALFIGHAPAGNSFMKQGKLEQHTIQFEDR